MIKNSFFIYLIYLYSIVVYGQDVPIGTENPICSLKGTKIYYLNGISNSRAQAEYSLEKMKDFINSGVTQNISRQKILDENKVDFVPLYNQTWFLGDLFVCAGQKIAEWLPAGIDDPEHVVAFALLGLLVTFRENNVVGDKSIERKNDNIDPDYIPSNLHQYFKKVIDKASVEKEFAEINDPLDKRLRTVTSDYGEKVAEAVRQDYKAIIVSHSQGNFYANSIYQYIVEKYPNLKEKLDRYVANLQVASPTSIRNFPQGARLTLDNDFIRFFGGSTVVKVSGDTSDFWNHNFIDAYLTDQLHVTSSEFITNSETTPRELVLAGIIKLSRSFPANCCHETDKEQRRGDGKLHVNPNGDLGGWIDSGSEVAEGVFLSKTSEVCNDSHIYSEEGAGGSIEGSVHINNSTIKFKNSSDDYLAGSLNAYGKKYFLTKNISVERQNIPGVFINKSEINLQSVTNIGVNDYFETDSKHPYPLKIDNSKINGACMSWIGPFADPISGGRAMNIVDSTIVKSSIENSDIIGSELLDSVGSESCSPVNDIVNSIIESRSKISASFIWDSEVNESSTISESNVDNSKVLASTISQMSNVFFSTVKNSTIENYSSVYSSLVENSSIANNSYAESSSIQDSDITYFSRIMGVTISNARKFMNICSPENVNDPEGDCNVIYDPAKKTRL